MKYILFDAANTLIHKPTLWPNMIEVFNEFGFNVETSILKERHKLLSEVIVFPDVTSKAFYHEFNSELLISLGIIPNEVLLETLFIRCSYLPWAAFEDCSVFKELSVKKVVISNFNTTLQSKIEELIGEKVFENFIVSEKEKIRKPSVEFYELAINRLGVNPSEIIYIGDSIKLDIIPAQSMGIRSLLIDRDMMYPNASNRISSFYELKDLI